MKLAGDLNLQGGRRTRTSKIKRDGRIQQLNAEQSRLCRLTLSLLASRIRFTNDVDPSFTTNDLAIRADLLNAGTNFHFDDFLMQLKLAAVVR